MFFFNTFKSKVLRGSLSFLIASSAIVPTAGTFVNAGTHDESHLCFSNSPQDMPVMRNHEERVLCDEFGVCPSIFPKNMRAVWENHGRVLRQRREKAARREAIESQYVVTSSPLHEAVERNDVERVAQLIREGAPMNVMKRYSVQVRPPMGTGPIAFFMEEKAYTAFQFAVYKGNLAVIREFLNAPDLDVNVINNEGTTALHIATEQARSAEIVQMLLDRGANVNAVNAEGETPLYSAAEKGDPSVVHLLLDKGADVNAGEPADGDTPLFRALDSVTSDKDPNRFEVLRLLLMGGANVNAINSYGDTPLEFVADYGTPDIAQLLIRAGANVNGCDVGGEYGSPLICAVEEGRFAMVRLLVENHADVDHVSLESGATALHQAVMHRDPRNTEYLIKHGRAKVDIEDRNGDTPLHLAVSRDFVAGVELLLEYAVPPLDAKNKDGNTPLHLAVLMDNVAVAEKLLKSRAPLDMPNNKGKTPEEMIKSDEMRDLFGHYRRS